MRNNSAERFIILFIPWFLAEIFKANAELSYLTAWIGSFFIFYITLTGKLKPLPNDRPTAEQMMRPIFLVQIIFIGYTCCSSIFYFFSIIGYEDFHKISDYYLVNPDILERTAQCQRYYCLGHAAFATGILMFMNYPDKQKYYYEKDKLATSLIRCLNIKKSLCSGYDIAHCSSE